MEFYFYPFGDGPDGGVLSLQSLWKESDHLIPAGIMFWETMHTKNPGMACW
jgi:hypothetical protein